MEDKLAKIVRKEWDKIDYEKVSSYAMKEL